MQNFKHVFSPFKLGTVEVRNRIEVSPMLAGMATPDGFVTREFIEFYQSFARGGAGIVTVGDSAVDYDYAPGHHLQLNIGDDRGVGGLSSLVEAIQKYGAKASIELNHAGRWASPRVLGGKNPIGPSPIPSVREETAARLEGRKKVKVQEMDQDMIYQVIENFVTACYNCLRAGFDMVMLHGGHGHLLGQFVSPYTNKRTDGYGGNLENRARFVIELLTAIRKKVGNRLAIEYRISGDEFVPEGMHLEDTIEFIKMIQDKIDLVHVSLGLVAGPVHSPYMNQPTYFPHVHNVERAAKVKEAVQIPVTCMGSIMDLATADKILAEGKADIVAMARAFVADPEIVNKTYYGQLDEIRPCLRCIVCSNRAGEYIPVRCTVNPVAGREIEYRLLRPAEQKKKVAIIGGGPAGMEAAIVASSRGHQVTIYEREKELGGALRYAVGPPFKSDMKKYLEWLVRKTQRSGAEIRLSTEVTARDIEDARPDTLIVAIGAEPIIPDIPGVKNQNVVWAGDVDINKVETGKKVVVVGAGATGCETALHLAQQGKQVTVIDMLPESEIAMDTSRALKNGLMELLEDNQVQFHNEVKLEEITDNGAIAIDRNWNRYEIPADTIVLSLGFTANREKIKSFQIIVPETYLIGDCLSPRNLMGAIHDAFNIAAEL